MKRLLLRLILIATAGVALSVASFAQPPAGGFGGPGGPNRPEIKLLENFDVDKSGWLNADERVPARKAAQAENSQRGAGGRGFGGRPGRGGPGFGGPGFGGPGAGRGRGGPGGRGPASQTPKPGPTVAEQDVAVFPDQALYDTSVLRTFFIEFENEDWEIELEDFHGTDVDVAATLKVDGKSYPNCGIRFRGMSSYSHVQRGSKRSFSVALALADEDQRLYGYKSLNLLNSHGDPSMMSSVLYSHIARQYIPAPKANFVHVVVNGKSWGLFDSVQQFDKTFVKENFNGSKGTRWKVRGNPWADGGLRYLGKDLAEYKTRFDMKSNDGEEEWRALVELCQTLNETPLTELESALEPMLDVEGVLKFLALDNALVNSDGYWTRASDYSIFRNSAGKFHIVPHDMNEAFALSNHAGGPPGGGPPGRRGERGGPRFEFGPPPGPERGGPGRGGPGGPGHGGVDLDPLVGLDSERMPLRSRLLAIPALRERYLAYVAQIAEESLEWKTLGPVVDDYRELIAPLVKKDTRKHDSYEAFVAATQDRASDSDAPMSVRRFSIERSKFLTSKK
jgi:hypothetical protein